MEQLEVAIIGAGLGGLCAAIRLLQQGVGALRIFERASEVGGTWRDNTYPGCACDIPSHLYSFSFAPSSAWTRAYPRQAEIQDYVLDVVQRFGLRAHLQLGTGVCALHWLAGERLWRVEAEDGRAWLARHVVCATGLLSRPVLPAIEGRAQFAGTQFHSAQWRHDVPLAGKRVAVVGTGASAVQIVPELAQVAAHVDVFQRTPPWVLARPDAPYSAARRALYARLPWLQRLNRWRLYWRNELFALGFLGSKRVQRAARAMALGYLAHKVADPALRARLIPDYAPGCKRILVSSDYYRALQQPQVALHTQAVTRVAPQGLVTADGALHACDTIVWCTGFAATAFVTPLSVFGEGGEELGARWQGGPAATHLGMSVAGFPNFFLVLGPGAVLGHNSVVFMIEAQVHYIVKALAALRRRGGTRLALRQEAQAHSYARLQHKMRGTVWASGCKSWYQSPDGRIDTLWPGFTWDYWLRTRRFPAALYEIG